MAVSEWIGGPQTFGDPAFGERDRVEHRVTMRKRAGHRDGQCVARAVVVSGVHPLRIELVKVVAVEQ